MAAVGFNDMAAAAGRRLPVEQKLAAQRRALHELLNDTAEVVSFSQRLKHIGGGGAPTVGLTVGS